MKILFVNEDLGYGGAEKMMAWLANHLADDSEMDVTFLTFRDADKNYQSLNERVNREHIQMESAGGSLSAIIKSSAILRKYLNEHEYDVAIAFLSPAQIRLGLAAKGLKTKVVLSQRADPYLKTHNSSLALKVFRIIFKYVFNSSDGFVFQTQKAMDYYPEKVQQRGKVIPNAIKPLERTTKRIAGGAYKTVVTVSRLELKQKRQDVLIKAFQIFQKSHPGYTLKLYGSGPDEARLKELAQNDPNIVFEGVTTNVIESIQDASMFVLSSDYEGIPNALLEAMSIGLPCISTDCSPGGASLLIDSPDCGIIVPCGDADSLSIAMGKYADNIDLAEAHGRNAMKVNERFSEDKISLMWVSFLKNFIN